MFPALETSQSGTAKRQTIKVARMKFKGLENPYFNF
jgi:hypothetical protein